jgi:16S rRNA (cytidine1402-2'-O)-methyltransferase
VSGRLVIVPTPIGHLGDMTWRAVEELKAADLIAAEDTRHSRRLLDHYGVTTPTTSYHDFSSEGERSRLIGRLRSGQTLALISDAGTPGISDPAYRLIQEALAAGADLCVLPGATSLVPALVGSGLPTDRFRFVGFLPRRKGRRTALDELAESPETTVFFESPHRLGALLVDLEQRCPERRLCVARELSKIHEEYLRGTVAELRQRLEAQGVRGEFVLVLEGAPAEARRRRRTPGADETEDD